MKSYDQFVGELSGQPSNSVNLILIIVKEKEYSIYSPFIKDSDK